MRILLDECLPLDLRHSFSYHTAHTAEWTGLKGKSNGELLDSLEAGVKNLPPLVPQVLETLESIVPGQTVTVPTRASSDQDEASAATRNP